MHLFLTVLLAGITLIASQLPEQPAAAGADLTGAWKLNRDLSDDPQSILPEASAPPAEPRPDGGGRREGRDGRSGRGSGSGPGFGFQTDGARRRVRDTIRAVCQTPERLTIVRIGATVSFTAGDGQVTNLFTGGEEEVHTVGPNIEIGTKTHWNAAQLVVDISVGARTPVTQTYSVATMDGKKQLRVVTSMDDESTQKTVRVTRVYDLAEN